jgi:Fur family ferric uptake transcriptional regulator
MTDPLAGQVGLRPQYRAGGTAGIDMDQPPLAHDVAATRTATQYRPIPSAADFVNRATNDRAEGAMTGSIIARCEAHGLRMTEQRRTIARVLEQSDDHRDVEELYNRTRAVDPRISLATVYRTVKLFDEAGILDRLEFGDGRARYEDAEREHHDHLIDITTGEVIEFVDPEIEALQERIAVKLGYTLKGHRLELYGVRIRKP